LIDSVGTQDNPIEINNDPYPYGTIQKEIGKEYVLEELVVEESPHFPIS